MKNAGEILLNELMESRTEHILKLLERLSSEKLKVIINEANKLLNEKDQTA
ncbi:MAG: hypothetical protein K6T29_08145 [Peptococcaceae bacterium]|nr:hypothetical protein [Peptococcaceae bacterium]